MKTFPNGFESWQETHYEVVSEIISYDEHGDFHHELVRAVMEDKGRGGLYELANDLTDEFETLHQGREWDGEFFEEIENFLDEKLR